MRTQIEAGQEFRTQVGVCWEASERSADAQPAAPEAAPKRDSKKPSRRLSETHGHTTSEHRGGGSEEVRGEWSWRRTAFMASRRRARECGTALRVRTA